METKTQLAIETLSSEYDVHPAQIAGWKRQAKEGMVAAFSGKVASVQVTVERIFKRAFTKR